MLSSSISQNVRQVYEISMYKSETSLYVETAISTKKREEVDDDTQSH